MIPSTLSLLMVLMLAGCSKSMPCSETNKAAALMTAGTATATPLLVLATSSTEPIPACHHCSVAPPKIEKHRRRKKPTAENPQTITIGNRSWTLYLNNEYKYVTVCSVLPPGVVVGGGDNCDFHNEADPLYCRYYHCSRDAAKLPYSCGTSFGCQNLEATELAIRRNPCRGENGCPNGKYSRYAFPFREKGMDVSGGMLPLAGSNGAGDADVQPAPAMTPQQFTDFMDDNFPGDPNPPYKMELCGGPDGCRPLTAEEINHLMREQPPIYPPSYKMPKGDQP